MKSIIGKLKIQDKLNKTKLSQLYPRGDRQRCSIHDFTTCHVQGSEKYACEKWVFQLIMKYDVLNLIPLAPMTCVAARNAQGVIM